MQRFLERAGETRLQRRMERWHPRAAAVGLGQAMYEAVLRSLGAAGYRHRFQDLARRLSWQEAQGCLQAVPIVDRTAAAEALLLGLAGILPQAVAIMAGMDAETRDYMAGLCRHWEMFPADIRQRAQTQSSWQQPHVRPANTPERRLTGMAQLLARHRDMDLLQAGLTLCRTHTSGSTARTLCKHLTALCETPEPSYWNRHAHFGSRPGKAQRLIGNQRALTVVIDAMLPLLLLAAQQQGDIGLCHTLLHGYRTAPRLPDNAVLRDMARRLLGDDPALLSLVTGARQQQGVLQIYEDFCSNDEGDCQGCGFPAIP